MTYLAVAQYEIESLPAWGAFEDKIVRIIEQAKENGAQLILMSEYAGLELGSWTQGPLKVQFDAIQTYHEAYTQLFTALAKDYQLHIQPGSLPVKEKDGSFRNRAYLFSPNGELAFQDKLFLTTLEKQSKLFTPGNDLTIFDTDLGKIGIVISYDVEFPTISHQLAKQGATLVLVPSCTEHLSGLTRLTIASRARAIENQCYVAQSCLIGKASWCEFIDINIGQSAIYSPAETGFPENGILAQAEINTPMIIYADVDEEKIVHTREHGERNNFADMQKAISHSFDVSETKMYE